MFLYDAIEKYKKENYLIWQEVAQNLNISKATISKYKQVRNGKLGLDDLRTSTLKNIRDTGLLDNKNIYEFQHMKIYKEEEAWKR